MNKLIASLLLLAATQLAAAEEVRYISDELRVPLRSSPGNKSKIIHHGLKAGTQLTFIEHNDEGWSRVQTARGLNGWLPSQYLVAQQVAKIRIRDVEQTVRNLTDRNNELKSALSGKDSELQTLQQQLSDLNADNSSVRDELTEIKKISSDAVNIHEQNLELAKRNKLLQSDVDRLTATNDQLKSDQIYTWFLYGALSVVLGALLTVLLPRLKVKRRYSEWG